MVPLFSKRFAIFLLAGAVLAACAPPAPPPQKEPTVAQVTLTATNDANPDPSGRASPAIVFLYALQPGAPYSTGDYQALTGGELGDLGETMSRIARLVIVPGKTTKKIFELPDGTSDIGVAVAFRDIGSAGWRAMASVKPAEVTLLKATIGRNAVTID